MKDKGMKGSYTIEAAAVFSIVIFVLGAFLFCTFYIHDKSVMQGAVCEIAAAGSNFSKEKERKEAAAEARKRISSDRFLGSQKIRSSASTGEKEVTASGNAVFPVPGFAMKYLADNQFFIQKQWASRILDPAQVIRKVRGAEKLFRIEKD